MHGYYPPPPFYGPPMFYPPMSYPPTPGQPNQAPQMQVEKLSPKMIKKALRFHQSLIDQLEQAAKKKGGDDKKKDDKALSTFNPLQWMMILIGTAPIAGLLYVKAILSLAASLPH